MSLSTLIAVSAQLWLLWYAVRAVTHRNDRRAPCQSSADALLGAAVFAAALLLSGVMFAFSDGRRFIVVRQIFELATVVSACTYAMAIQTMKGKRR